MATRQAINACLNATAELIPGLMAGAADLTGNTGMQLEGRRAAVGRAPRRPPALLRHPRARHGRGHDRAWPATAASCRSAAPSSSSATTCGRRSAWPPCPRPTSSTPGPTTRSAWARTARPTSPSSSWPPCGPCPGCGCIRPADANECAQAWRLAVDGDGPTALVLTRQDAPGAGGDGRAGRRRGGPRRLRAGRRDGWPGPGRPGRHRQRGAASAWPRPPCWPPRACGPGWCRCPRWELFEAQDEAYRQSVLPPGVPTPVGRGGGVLRLGPLRRRLGGHRHLRGLGPRRGGAGRVRVHPRATWPSGPPALLDRPIGLGPRRAPRRSR